jgi:methionine-rich copper-binding protein CopC
MKGARLLVVIWALAVACPAWGHAFLERAEPRVGSTVRSAPPQVRVWFTQNLEPAFSTL